MKSSVVGVIFARGGSKTVPGKNIRMLGGKPLIAYAIETARAVPAITRVVVSTDSDEIAASARQWGAEVPFIRPADLARDDSPELLAWQHALRALGSGVLEAMPDVLVSVPTTAPLRSAEDVSACVGALLESDADIAITVTPARRSPYFNMVTLEGGYAHLVSRPAASGPYRRQDARAVYDMTTVAYAARRDYVLGASSILQGKVKAVVVPEERALDIDTELDLQIAEFLLARRAALTGAAT